MSARDIGDNRPEKVARPLGAARQPNAQELLAEFERVLEITGYPPVSPPPSTASASAPTAEPRNSAAVGTEGGADDDPSADGSRDPGPTGRGARGPRNDPVGKPARRPSRRWKLAASALALGFAAVAGASLTLLPSVFAPKSPLSQALTQRQPSSDVRDAPIGDSGGQTNAAEPTARTPAPLDGQRPADGSNPTAATSTDTPAPATAPAHASTAAPTPSPEPVPSGPVKPNDAPVETRPADATVSPSPGEAPKPRDTAAHAAGVKVEPARPPAAKIDPATRPTPGKSSAQTVAARPEKARTGATAETPYPPPRPAPPRKAAASQKAAVSPAAQPAPDPAAAAPAAAAPVAPPPPPPPASFAAQSVGQLTNALTYLTRLPGALIGRAAGQGDQGR